MSHIIHYNNCPVCGSGDIKNVLSTRDYSVSGETFCIGACSNCSLRFTLDVPDLSSIASYYASEDYISHSNTSKGFVNRLYKSVRKKTMKKKRRLITRILGIQTGDLLDVGSGTGSFVHEMRRKGWRVTGLEPDERARQVARKTYGIELASIKDLGRLKPASFDAISLWHVLEHVHDLKGTVRQLKILLKENGRLFIAVPNYASEDASVYREFWAAWDTPRHLYHFSPRAMSVLMENSGLKVEKYKPMWYDSFYISLLSSKYKNGKANLFAAFWNGFRSNLKAMRDVKKCSSVIYIISK